MVWQPTKRAASFDLTATIDERDPLAKARATAWGWSMRGAVRVELNSRSVYYECGDPRLISFFLYLFVE